MISFKPSKFALFIAISALTSTMITACGGGGGSDSTVITPPSHNSEPIKIGSSSWKNNQLLSRGTVSVSTLVHRARPYMDITISGLNYSSNRHWQVYLDLDNNPNTGFQFDDEAWTNQSGVDYLIEDGTLYKSTANDTSWSWDYIGPAIKTTYNQGKITTRFSVKQHGKLCKDFKVGVVGLDGNWSIDTYYPASNNMLSQKTHYCNASVNKPPVITLRGSSPLVVTQGTPFNDPGATARDREDGNISSNVVVDYSDVNTSVPSANYTVVYTVADSGGLRVYKNRRVVVKDRQSTGIIIDGSAGDWSNISPLAQTSNGTIKVTDNKHYYYVMVNSSNLGSNWSVFIDSDNKASTGFKLNHSAADYIVENNILSRFIGQNQNEWAWNYNSSNILTANTANVLEMAIPKSALHNLKNKSSVGFMSLDGNWNTQYLLPNLLKDYTLKFPVTPVNKAPTAVNDAASTTNAAPISINVLANDTDPDSDALTITQVTSTVNGTTSIVGNRIKFVPKANFVGTTSFNYTINDGHSHTATARVNVTVSQSNRAPKAVNDTASTSNTKTVTINALGNDSDPDHDALTITRVSNPAKGTATIVSNKIKFVPKANFVGTATFTYTISDGHSHTATATVSVTVSSSNRAPIAVNDTVSTNNKTPITINALSNDSDPDNDALSIVLVSTPAKGTTRIVANKIKYTPKANHVGKVTFTYKISDAHSHTATATVTVNVGSSNRAPRAVNDTAKTTNKKPVTINVLANDTDPDNDPLSITLVSNPAKGTAVIVANKIKFTPKANHVGSATFTYKISDAHSHTATATVTVTVTANHAPNAVEDAPSTNHTVPVTINVLQNDTDVDGDTLTVTSITQPSFGKTTLKANGSVVFDPQGHVGSHAFSYTISDGHGGTDSAVVTIATSDPNGGHDNYPNIKNENVTTRKNHAVFINVLANDTDADGDVLILDQVDWGDHGTTTKVNGGVLYTPNAGFTGTDLFYYGVHDGYGHNGTGIVHVTITP